MCCGSETTGILLRLLSVFILHTKCKAHQCVYIYVNTIILVCKLHLFPAYGARAGQNFITWRFQGKSDLKKKETKDAIFQIIGCGKRSAHQENKSLYSRCEEKKFKKEKRNNIFINYTEKNRVSINVNISSIYKYMIMYIGGTKKYGRCGGCIN